MRLLTSILLIVALVRAAAQTTSEAMLADPLKCAGVYMPYPDSIGAETPVPVGYTPFYISHYGRHGSRYLINETDYDTVTDAFVKASVDGALTPLGIDVLSRLCIVRSEADGRAGELAPLGYRQHRDIAERMLMQCPSVFDSQANVTAVSTTKMRCAHSMFAFVSRLKEFNPAMTISVESSERNMYYLSYNNREAQRFNSPKAGWLSGLGEFKLKKTNPGRLVKTLFLEVADVVRYMDPNNLMWALYWIAVDLPNMECGVSLFDIFTPAELFDLWQVFNYEFYTRNSCNPINNGVFMESAKNLLANFIDTADRYVTDNKHGATLRFGHDSTVIPFAALLGIPYASGRESNPELLYKVYADYRVSPMASNIQMRLYKNADGDVIAKFMLNEQEVPLPDTYTDTYPYYTWSAARNTLQRLLETPVTIN